MAEWPPKWMPKCSNNRQKIKPPFGKIWIDPIFLKQKKEYTYWIKEATFDYDMYANLKAVICRPGVGTLTDSLVFKSKVFCVSERGNDEMYTNIKKIEKYKVGVAFDSLSKAYTSACEYSLDENKIQEYLDANKKINFNGINEMTEIIKNIKGRSDA